MANEGMKPGPSIMGAKTHERWKAERDERPFKSSVAEPHATGSQAHQCARKIAFNAFGVRRSEPENEWNIVTFKIGQRVHDFIQQTLVDEFGAQLEVRVDMRPLAYVTGFADGLLPNHPETGEAGNTIIEIKSMAQYGFDIAVGNKGNSPGPKAEHITQGAMYGVKLGAKWLWLIYYGKDKGTTAEWIFGMDDPLPHLDGITPRELADAEIARMAQILEQGNDGALPPRMIPGHGLVKNPLDDNECWQCRYCNWRTTCANAKDDATLETLLAPVAIELPDEGDDMKRLQIVRRIENLSTGQRGELAKAWPKGVPTLKASGDHTEEQLAAIVDVLDRIAGFEVDDLSRDTVPDEGATMTPEDIEAMRRCVNALSGEEMFIFSMLGKQAAEAGTPVALSQNPTERRFEITRAAIRLAQYTFESWSDETTIDLLAQFFDGQIPSTAAPGAVLAAMTIEEARQTAAVLDALIAGSSLVKYEGSKLTIVPAA